MSIPKHINNHIVKLYDASKHELGWDTNERIKKFRTILHLYYPWAKKPELNNMLILINDKETQYQNEYWKDNITRTYKYDIVTLFGIVDHNSNKKIDIHEFISTFISVTNYDKEALKRLFKEADADKNGSLDILEFIDLISKYPILRNNLDNAITAQQKIQKRMTKERLSILFKDVPNSPSRINWRPSLSQLQSPTTINRWLQQSG